MSKIVVISGHPNLDKSNTNALILEMLHNADTDISIRFLDRLYGEGKIDVAAEQAALLAADTIVLQFPFYWYSVPALLKSWIDQVFEYGFAYGAKGDKLKGKKLVLSFTIGGPAESYKPDSYNTFSIEDLIKPLVQTANLTGMVLQKPIYSHSMVYIPSVFNTLEGVQARAKEHAERLLSELGG